MSDTCASDYEVKERWSVKQLMDVSIVLWRLMISTLL